MLNPKQQIFCDEYLKDFNGTRAAAAAGYSKKNAKISATQLLSSTNVQAYLAEKKAILSAKHAVTLDMIVEGYRKLAFFDSRKFFKKGKLQSVDDLDDDTAFALSGFEAVQADTDFGIKLTTSKIKMSDRNRALDSLCRVFGFNAPDKVANVNSAGDDVKPTALLTDEQFKALLKTINSK